MSKIVEIGYKKAILALPVRICGRNMQVIDINEMKEMGINCQLALTDHGLTVKTKGPRGDGSEETNMYLVPYHNVSILQG